VDALTRRLLELSVVESGDVGVEFAWLALGSQARREALPSSDVDSAIVWFGSPGDPDVHARLQAVGRTVVSELEACGLRADEHGATASDARFVRSLDSWKRAVRSWIDDPTQ
jgi:CBS domain-containing protein